MAGTRGGGRRSRKSCAEDEQRIRLWTDERSKERASERTNERNVPRRQTLVETRDSSMNRFVFLSNESLAASVLCAPSPLLHALIACPSGGRSCALSPVLPLSLPVSVRGPLAPASLASGHAIEAAQLMHDRRLRSDPSSASSAPPAAVSGRELASLWPLSPSCSLQSRQLSPSAALLPEFLISRPRSSVPLSLLWLSCLAVVISGDRLFVLR